MTKLPASVAVIVSVLASSSAFAAEKTITLAVQHMTCAALPRNGQGEPSSRAWRYQCRRVIRR